MRNQEISRKTAETEIDLWLELDGEGKSSIDTGVGFLDHMLTLLAKHARFDLVVTCIGDTYVDDHHSVEDIGIALGKAFSDALGDKRGINRYGDTTLPMDEALILTAVDISGRSVLEYDVKIPTEKVGTFDTELVEEFLTAFVRNAGINLHVIGLKGRNTHHIIEGIFKSLARTLRHAVAIDAAHPDEIPSTKGVLDDAGTPGGIVDEEIPGYEDMEDAYDEVGDLDYEEPAPIEEEPAEEPAPVTEEVSEEAFEEEPVEASAPAEEEAPEEEPAPAEEEPEEEPAPVAEEEPAAEPEPEAEAAVAYEEVTDEDLEDAYDEVGDLDYEEPAPAAVEEDTEEFEVDPIEHIPEEAIIYPDEEEAYAETFDGEPYEEPEDEEPDYEAEREADNKKALYSFTLPDIGSPDEIDYQSMTANFGWGNSIFDDYENKDPDEDDIDKLAERMARTSLSDERAERAAEEMSRLDLDKEFESMGLDDEYVRGSGIAHGFTAADLPIKDLEMELNEKGLL